MMRIGYLIGLSALGLFVACGGKTDTGGDGGSGGASGGKGGTPGNGGVTSGGGTGAIATGGGGAPVIGGGGGMMGGMAGIAGMGTGGMPIGGTGGTLGLQEKGQKLCAEASTMPCVIPDCTNQMSQGIDIAIKTGCTEELNALLDCALQYPLYCDKNGKLQISAACDPITQAFQDCINNGSNCSSWGSSDGSCGVDCNNWSASCKTVSGGMTCVCTQGPHQGAQFKTTDATCSGSTFDQIAQATCA